MTLTAPTTRLATLLAALALTAGLAACGEKPEDATAVRERDQVTVMLDDVPHANHAAIYAAQSTGAFERAGLDVTIEPGKGARTALAMLTAGDADFAVSSQPQMMLARNEAEKVQSVATLVQKPLAALISLPKRPIRSATDLEGRTVGTGGLPLDAAMLRQVVDTAGIPVDRVRNRNLGLGLNRPLITGRVDATLGAFWNDDAIALERSKRKPIVLKIETLGVPSYSELVLAASEATVRDRGPLVRRFVQAVGLGASAVRKDPKVGVDAVMQSGAKLDRELQQQALAATLPVMFPEDDDKPWGWHDVNDWAEYGVWLEQSKLLKTAKLAARATTNEYLGGEGVGDRTD